MEAEIRKLIDDYTGAFENQDWGLLRELCSKDAVFSSSGGAQEDLESVIRRYQGHVSDYKVNTSNMRIGVSGDRKIAWAKYDTHAEFLWDGIQRVGEVTYTATIEKRDSQWVLTHLHSVRPRLRDVRKHIDLEKHDQNMLEYYAKLASDSRGEYFKELLAGHDVLEVACGIGEWTLDICQTANSVLATDVSDETLDVARSYTYPEGKVTYQKASAYSLEGVTGTFSAGFHSSWFSHVPLSRRDEFLNAFHSKLQPGALAVFTDAAWGGRQVDEAGNMYDIRRLRDGTEYEIIKNWPTEQELRDMLKDVASDIQYKSFGRYWVISYRLK